jgi:hypothetical protein
MAHAFQRFTYAIATVVAPGTAVAPSVALPDNCLEVLIRNPGPGLALAGISAVGAALAEGVDATGIPAGTSATLDVGIQQMVGTDLVYDATAAGVVYITYVNRLGA